MFELSRVIVNEMSDRQMLFLKERDGDRYLPIAVGNNKIQLQPIKWVPASATGFGGR